MHTTSNSTFKAQILSILIRQLQSNILKADLIKALQQLNPEADVSGLKNDLINDIANALLSELMRIKQAPDAANKAIQFLRSWFKNYLCYIPTSTGVKSLEDIFKKDFRSSGDPKPQKTLKPNQTLVSNLHPTSDPYPCICPRAPSFLAESKISETCYMCGVNFHFDCLFGRPKQLIRPFQNPVLVECPQCFLTKCIPQKQVKQVLFAGYLPTSKSSRIEFLVNFNVPKQLKSNKSLSIEARCMRIKPQHEYNKYEQMWPDNSIVYLNRKKLMDFKPLSSNSCLKRRFDEEIVMDKSLFTCDEFEQMIIEEKHEYENGLRRYEDASHFVMVVVVQNQSQEKLLQKFNQSRLSTQQSKQILRNYLQSNTSSDIQLDKFNISLVCTYYFSKITIPVRSRHCTTHFQPFDLRNFIYANVSISKGQKYKCPICKKRAYDLVVDEYVQELINSKSNGENVTSVSFRADGEPHFQEGKEGEEQGDGEENMNEENQGKTEENGQNMVEKVSGNKDCIEQTEKQNLLEKEEQQKIVEEINLIDLQDREEQQNHIGQVNNDKQRLKLSKTLSLPQKPATLPQKQIVFPSKTLSLPQNPINPESQYLKPSSLIPQKINSKSPEQFPHKRNRQMSVEQHQSKQKVLQTIRKHLKKNQTSMQIEETLARNKSNDNKNLIDNTKGNQNDFKAIPNENNKDKIQLENKTTKNMIQEINMPIKPISFSLKDSKPDIEKRIVSDSTTGMGNNSISNSESNRIRSNDNSDYANCNNQSNRIIGNKDKIDWREERQPIIQAILISSDDEEQQNENPSHKPPNTIQPPSNPKRKTLTNIPPQKPKPQSKDLPQPIRPNKTTSKPAPNPKQTQPNTTTGESTNKKKANKQKNNTLNNKNKSQESFEEESSYEQYQFLSSDSQNVNTGNIGMNGNSSKNINGNKSKTDSKIGNNKVQKLAKNKNIQQNNLEFQSFMDQSQQMSDKYNKDDLYFGDQSQASGPVFLHKNQQNQNQHQHTQSKPPQTLNPQPNTYHNPIHLSQQSQPAEPQQSSFHPQPLPLQNISQQKPVESLPPAQVQLIQLRQQVQKSNRHIKQRLYRMYGVQTVEEEDEKLFLEMLEELNLANDMKVFC